MSATLKNNTEIENLNINREKLLKKINKVKDAEMTYVIIDCPNADLETFNLKESAYKEGGVSKRRTEKELTNYFSEFKKEILTRKTACYAVYDFGFYIDEEKENYRTALLLIVYVPDSLKPRQKVFYSVSAKELCSIIGVNRSLTITNSDSLTFEKFLEEVKLHQKH